MAKGPRCGDPDTPGGPPGAHNRAGEPCGKPRGWGTNHVGFGRCKAHGGSAPIKHGRYSKIARARLADVLVDIEADADPLNLRPELDLIRAQAMHFLGKHGPSPVVVDMLEKVAKIVDLMQKHQKEGSITLLTLHRVIEQLGASVARHVADPDILAKIERDWGAIQLGS